MNAGGYVYERVMCPHCGRYVAGNWYIQHVKSGCKVGFKTHAASKKHRRLRP